jgi:glycine betaine/choline ABC-type transport system substrate-binding protein
VQGVPGASIAQTLQALNSKIAVEGQDAKSVAKEYLAAKGFLK